MTNFQKNFKNYGDISLYRIYLESSENLEEDLNFLHKQNSSYGNHVLFEYYFRIWKKTGKFNEWLVKEIECKFKNESIKSDYINILWNYYVETKQWYNAYKIICSANCDNYLECINFLLENKVAMLEICKQNERMITIPAKFIAKIIEENEILNYHPDRSEYQKALKHFNDNKN